MIILKQKYTKESVLIISIVEIKILNMSVNNYYKYSLFIMFWKIKRMILFIIPKILVEQCGYKDFAFADSDHDDNDDNDK